MRDGGPELSLTRRQLHSAQAALAEAEQVCCLPPCISFLTVNAAAGCPYKRPTTASGWLLSEMQPKPVRHQSHQKGWYRGSYQVNMCIVFVHEHAARLSSCRQRSQQRVTPAMRAHHPDLLCRAPGRQRRPWQRSKVGLCSLRLPMQSSDRGWAACRNSRRK